MPDPAGVLLAGRTAALGTPDPGWLTDAERARAGALVREADRADFVAAHVLARRAAAAVLGADPRELTVLQHCPGCGASGHGRPSIAGAPRLGVSLAHTPGYVAAAAGVAAVGVDVERVPPPSRIDDVAAMVLAPAELAAVRSAADPAAAFARIWVRKEALVKLGLADLDTLPATDVSDSLADAATWRGHRVLGWSDAGVVGALVSARPPDLVDLR